MKKVLTALVIAAVTVPVFAAFKHPGFTTKDMAKIDEAMATAKSPREKSIAIIMKNLATNQYPAFADFSNMVDKVVAENYITEKNMKKRDVVFLKKQFVLARGEYTESFWNFCKENPDFYDFYICKNKGFRKKYNISDKDCYTALIRCMSTSPQAYNSKDAIAILDGLKKVAGDAVSAEQQTADLNKLKAAYQKRGKTEVIEKIDSLLK